MKITLIHGEDTTASRKFYLEAIDHARAGGFVVSDISTQTNLDLGEKLTGGSLFEEKILFVHDKLKNLTPSDLGWLIKNSQKYEGELVLWYEGNAPLRIIKALPKGVGIKKFDLPRIIFNFLDSFYPGNSKNVLRILGELVKLQPIEFVLFMLGRHLRDLYWVANDNVIVPNYDGWRIKKLTNQAGRFTNERLRKIINLLSEADIRSKTTDSSLKEFLDLTIVTQLK